MKKKECKEYCQACNEYVDYEVKKVKKTIQVKGETLNVEIYECYCAKCGEAIFVYEYEKLNDNIVYDAYKKRVGLLTSSDIKEIRRKRGMTQIDLAKFLSIGEKDITRYESGSIQNKCIDKMLRLVQDDSSYEEMARVFYADTESVWFDLKPTKWDLDKMFMIKLINLTEEDFLDPYKDSLKIFKEEGDLNNNYGDERREEVSIA